MRRLLALASLALVSCTPATLAGLQTADTIVRGACGAILAADGEPSSSLEALARAQRDISAQLAAAAEKDDPARTAEIVARLAALQRAQAAAAAALADLAARSMPAPAPMPTCPIAPAPPSTP